jgi:hypothetical protein
MPRTKQLHQNHRGQHDTVAIQCCESLFVCPPEPPIAPRAQEPYIGGGNNEQSDCGMQRNMPASHGAW